MIVTGTVTKCVKCEQMIPLFYAAERRRYGESHQDGTQKSGHGLSCSESESESRLADHGPRPPVVMVASARSRFRSCSFKFKCWNFLMTT